MSSAKSSFANRALSASALSLKPFSRPWAMIQNYRQLRLSLGFLLIAGVVASSSIGCGGGPRLYRVSGNVTFAGNPIPFGKIYFTPDGAKENSGTPGFAA